MAKYLDLAGTAYLWDKICVKIESETSSLYETVNLTVTDPVGGGGLSTTVTVTYNDTINTYSYNSSTITFKVPIDAEYTITIADNDNYRTPDPYTRTAIGNNKISITISYLEPLPDNGVYIYGVDGKFYTTDNWNQGSNATGVAVITDKARLIVAPDEWYTTDGSNYDGAWNGNKRSAWGKYGVEITGIKTTSTSWEATDDFAGSFNTDQIISQLNGIADTYFTGAAAAEYCRAYSKGCKGVGEWYLPALGELDVIASNSSTINSALNKISGDIFENPNLTYPRTWSSTQCNSGEAWTFSWNGRYFDQERKHEFNGVRPVCSF